MALNHLEHKESPFVEYGILIECAGKSRLFRQNGKPYRANEVEAGEMRNALIINARAGGTFRNCTSIEVVNLLEFLETD